MENPEEILHSLEEFAKMKPKDIPRELEEYLKFVAKTGDPIYQWPAIKSLFREKFINVITEFYESCSSMEIPPCPNVEMFNYDLMKNFILEKLDTFASAPFTLQRICELLTSPRKEYTRIDKYMRALEKNILVVSTMEPGGRRTENGEGIMNGIESDHAIESDPEPVNVINVEEMDDSPYIQTKMDELPIDSPYIQTVNHVAEHISFDSSKNSSQVEIENTMETFAADKITSEASSSSQEIVCVRYVSIEPVTGDSTQNIMEETKEPDVSVTITAVNIKDNDQDKPQITEEEIQQTQATLTENALENTEVVTENVKKTDVEPEPEVIMETETAESTDDILKTENIVVSSLQVSETTPTTTVPDKPEEINKTTSECEIVSESVDNESVSPENSITSSDSCSSEPSSEVTAPDEVPLSNLNTDLSDISVEETTETPKDETVEEKIEDLKKGNSDIVDSTTNSSGDHNIEHELSEQPESEKSEIEVSIEIPQAETKCGKETSEVVQSPEGANDDSNDVTETSAPAPAVPDESLEADKIKQSIEENPEPKVEELPTSMSEEVSCSEEKETDIEEKETAMEVDPVPESTSDAIASEETPIKEPESSEPPENP